MFARFRKSRSLGRFLLPRVGLLLFGLFFALLALELFLRKAGNLEPKAPPAPFFDVVRCPRNSMLYYEFEYPREKGPGVYRIMTVGDSFSLGRGVSMDDIYPKRLERYLNSYGNRTGAVYEVINFSLSGQSTMDEVRTIKRRIDEFVPDLILVGYCLNDPEDGADPKELLRVRDRFHYKRYSRPPGPIGMVCKRFKIADFAVRTAFNLRAKMGYRKYFLYLHSDEHRGWHKSKEALKELKELAEAKEIEILFVVFPVFIADIGPSYPFRAVHHVVHEALEHAGLPYLDLMPYYEGHDARRLALVPGRDPHPSEVAHRIAAEALLRELKERALVPDAGTAQSANELFPRRSPHLLRTESCQDGPARPE